MSSLSVTLNSSLATAGISNASPSQLDAIAGTVSGTVESKRTASTDTPKQDAKKAPTDTVELSPAAQRRIAELKRIDAEVRAHEQAHISAGRGVITSGPTYTYTYGPDGKRYAIGGEVGIDTSPEREPRANIDKGQRIQDAALAPAQPSPQDYQVASVGKQLESQGRADLMTEQRAQQAEAAASRKASTAAYTTSYSDSSKGTTLDTFA